MTVLCGICAAFLLEDEIDHCREGLCKDCCEESYFVDSENCDNDQCAFYDDCNGKEAGNED